MFVGENLRKLLLQFDHVQLILTSDKTHLRINYRRWASIHTFALRPQAPPPAIGSGASCNARSRLGQCSPTCTGDLARKKIYPALFALYYENMLPKNFSIFGFARSKMDDAAFRDYIMQVGMPCQLCVCDGVGGGGTERPDLCRSFSHVTFHEHIMQVVPLCSVIDVASSSG